MTRAVRIGSLDLRIFDDGMLKTSLDLLFDIDRTEAAELAGAQPDGSVFIPVNNFLFQRDGATVLIDAGAGNTMQPTLGKLPDNLRAGGVSPADVTHILLTHLHPDHANGLVDDAGHAIYPNAKSSSSHASTTSGCRTMSPAIGDRTQDPRPQPREPRAIPRAPAAPSRR